MKMSEFSSRAAFKTLLYRAEANTVVCLAFAPIGAALAHGDMVRSSGFRTFSQERGRCGRIPTHARVQASPSPRQMHLAPKGPRLFATAGTRRRLPFLKVQDTAGRGARFVRRRNSQRSTIVRVDTASPRCYRTQGSVGERGGGSGLRGRYTRRGKGVEERRRNRVAVG